MILLGGGVVWAGFTLMWWGRNRARGCSTSFRELVVPGAYKGCSPMSSSPSVTYGPSAPGGLGSVNGGYGIQGPGGNVTGVRP